MEDTNNSLRTILSADGAAILDASRGQITTLNTTAAYIWQGLQRGESAGEIAANLARDTGERLRGVEQDVTSFLAELEEQHLCPR